MKRKPVRTPALSLLGEPTQIELMPEFKDFTLKPDAFQEFKARIEARPLPGQAPLPQTQEDSRG